MSLRHQLFVVLSVFFFCFESLCPSIFQLTATGVAGLHGLTVTSRVTVETRQETASVIILARGTAKVRKLKLSPVIWTAVQVFAFGR